MKSSYPLQWIVNTRCRCTGFEIETETRTSGKTLQSHDAYYVQQLHTPEYDT